MSDFSKLSATHSALTSAAIYAAVFTFPSAALAADGSAQMTADACHIVSASSESLDTAKSLYAQYCSTQQRQDCDPLPDGGWACASIKIGGEISMATLLGNPASNQATDTAATPEMPDATATGEDGADTGAEAGTEAAEPADAAANPSSTAAVSATATAPISSAADAVCFVQSQNGLAAAQRSFADSCAGYTRRDCDPQGSAWICSSAILGNNAPKGSVTTSASIASASVSAGNSAGSSDSGASQPEPAASIASSATSTSVTVASNVSATVNSAGNTPRGLLGEFDLLVLHYDNCPDRDDGHAIAAGKSVVNRLGINRVLVVNGTCGNSIRDRFVTASFAVIEAAWQQNYLNADANRSSAAADAANRWAATLANGGNVWVAEGGQSDFSADVVRLVSQQLPAADLKRIHIVQHSGGAPQAYNERYTDAQNLAYLKSQTDYQLIPNGNAGGNGSANLNQQSSQFVAIARSSAFSTEWNAAFNYLRPDCAVRTENCKLDFSDTVELLHIVQDTTTSSVESFANRYLQ